MQSPKMIWCLFITKTSMIYGRQINCRPYHLSDITLSRHFVARSVATSLNSKNQSIPCSNNCIDDHRCTCPCKGQQCEGDEKRTINTDLIQDASHSITTTTDGTTLCIRILTTHLSSFQEKTLYSHNQRL